MDDRDRERFMQARVGPGVYELRMVAVARTKSSAAIEITAQMLHRELLTTARRLADHEEHGAAVIVAQTASEVQVERAIAALLRKRGIEDDLHEALSKFVRSYNLWPRNAPLRRLWESLSGDTALAEQPFWRGPLGQHVERRNRIAHRGADVSAADANQSILVVLELMEHMEAVVAKHLPPVKIKVKRSD
jgi:hypothetical protein